MNRRGVASAAIILGVFCSGAQNLFGQRDRIAGIDAGSRVSLGGHVHPLANAGNDQGRADAAMRMEGMTLTFAPSAAQQAELDALLARQQDPSSPDYHGWLTPEAYADRFGLSAADLSRVQAWLEGEGLRIVSVARGRNHVVFSGTAGQVEKAFRTEIHRYAAEGTTHYANATEPSVPAALGGVVSSIRGLHDFRLKPHAIRLTPRREADLSPHFTAPATSSANGCAPATGEPQIVPDDIATIYDVKALYAKGIDGTGQKVAIVGQSQIVPADIAAFRTCFGLAANVPQTVLVPGLRDPGISPGDEGESDLDIETVGGVARGAQVVFVYSYNVVDAITYAIDNNLAPVVSTSYGACEATVGTVYAASDRSLAQKGNALGITWIAAAGDSGAADCYDPTIKTAAPLSVDEPGTIPEVTSVGGTELAEGSGNYWAAANTANLASALSWIPETAWNDSGTAGSPASGGGGASTFFTKPVWQTGSGVPADGARDVPDIAFSASADHDGYLIYSSDTSGGSGSCAVSATATPPCLQILGGTSAAAPLFAGLVTLLNQYQVANGLQKTAGMGNVNPRLYAMAAAAGNAFHDVTTGNNTVNPCPPRAKGCNPAPIGFNAAPGYDLATGLGSVDAFNLVTGWGQAVTKPAATLTLTASPQSVVTTGSTLLTATLSGGTAQSGATPQTPTGTVTWSAGTTQLGVSSVSGAAGKATATLTVQAASLATGGNAITASYSGDASFGAGSATLAVTVTVPAPAVTGVVNGAAGGSAASQVVTPGSYIAIYGSGFMTGSPVINSNIPLPTTLGGIQLTLGGVAMPLAYVSSGQVNAIVPQTLAPGSSYALRIIRNGATALLGTLSVVALQPGIFTYNASGSGQGIVGIANTALLAGPAGNGFAPAKRGTDYLLIYCTGLGPVTSASGQPAPADGAAASSTVLYKTTGTVTATIGGVTVPALFAGLTPTLVALYQVNVPVPANAPAGNAVPVTITITPPTGGPPVVSNTVTVALQ